MQRETFLVMVVFGAIIAIMIYDIRALFIVVNSKKIELQASYCLIAILCMLLAIWSTYFSSYASGKHTQVWGWPIPVFTAHLPHDEFAYNDALLPTFGFAYPLNVALFLFIPSLITSAIARRSDKSSVP